MRCPFCAHDDSQVKDSRPTEDNAAIRRRRQCESCGARFTTFERVQLRDIAVVKSGNATSPRANLRPRQDRTVGCACLPQARDCAGTARPARIRASSARSRRWATAKFPPRSIGEMVMDGLRQLDSVAYIRFASVYRDFSRSAGFRGIRQQCARCRRQTEPPVIVLVRPQLGENIGKAARAMLNFGLTEMRLVAPRDGWPNPDCRPGCGGRGHRAGTGAGLRHAWPKRSPTARMSMPPRCASAASPSRW